jgi:HAD superfamily hydrolase (TIGR01509 family)
LSLVSHTLPAAVLWDMDGTLVDTEPYWLRAEVDLVKSFGREWSHEDGLKLIGAGLWHSARVLRASGVVMGEQEIIDHLTGRVIEQLVEKGIPWRPGAQELLLELRNAGIKTGLVTMSISTMANHVADRLGFVGFDVIVAGDDVTHSKPHPQPYLMAAELLGVNIADCVALEDSEPGIASASASGAVTVGVPFMIDIAESPEYTLWPTLAGRRVAHLIEHFQAVKG